MLSTISKQFSCTQTWTAAENEILHIHYLIHMRKFHPGFPWEHLHAVIEEMENRPGMFWDGCFFPQILIFFHSSASCFQFLPYWPWLVWLFTHTWEIYLQISRDCWFCSSHLKEKMTLRLEPILQKDGTARDITGKQKSKWRPWLLTREWNGKWLSGIQSINDHTVRRIIWWYRLGKIPSRQTEWKTNMGRTYGGGRKEGFRLERYWMKKKLESSSQKYRWVKREGEMGCYGAGRTAQIWSLKEHEKCA